MPGAPGESFRNAGIQLRERESQTEIDQPESDFRELSHADAALRSDVAASVPEVSEAPPVDIRLPDRTLPTIGAGVPVLPEVAMPSVDDIVSPATGTPASRSTLQTGETSFVDIRDSGSRFVYLIDCSGSMYEAPMQYARRQLKSSIRRLTRQQQFQIIFYNNSSRMMTLKSRPGADMYRATTLNVTDACDFVNRIQPDGGTSHLPALRRALRLAPEVLFFLTDAETRLAAGEIDAVKRLNNGRSRVHCIQFGEGPELQVPNWLRQIAAQNDGQYRHVDVKRIDDSRR